MLASRRQYTFAHSPQGAKVRGCEGARVPSHLSVFMTECFVTTEEEVARIGYQRTGGCVPARTADHVLRTGPARRRWLHDVDDPRPAGQLRADRPLWRAAGLYA